MTAVATNVTSLDPFAWAKLSAQRAYVSWFRAGKTPTLEEACAALNITFSYEDDACFAGEDPDHVRAHLNCLELRDGEEGGVCVSIARRDADVFGGSALRWAIGIALAWAMGAPFAGEAFGYADRDCTDPLWDAFDAIAELLLVPEEIVGDLHYRDAHKTLTTVSPALVESAIESRTLGSGRHEAALVAFAEELAARRAQEAA